MPTEGYQRNSRILRWHARNAKTRQNFESHVTFLAYGLKHSFSKALKMCLCFSFLLAMTCFEEENSFCGWLDWYGQHTLQPRPNTLKHQEFQDGYMIALVPSLGQVFSAP